MRDPYTRIVNLKLVIGAVLLSVFGLALMAYGSYLDSLDQSSFISALSSNVGGTLLIAGLVGITLDQWLDRDRGASLSRLIEKIMLRVMARLVPALRDSVIQAFADNVNNLSIVASDELLDNLARNALALRLGDVDFAEDIYEDVRDQAIASAERWRDTRISMQLSPDVSGLPVATGSGSSASAPALFTLTVRYEYTVVPTVQVRKFTAVSDTAEYRTLIDDPSETSVWYINPGTGMHGADKHAFELVDFAVDGALQKIHRNSRTSGQSYSVNLGTDIIEARQPVTLSYTYRTILRQAGHMVHVDVEQPSKGLDVDLDYGDCGIAEMRLIPFIASSKQVRSHVMPPTVPEKTVSIGFDGWVMPKQGVVAVWILASELDRSDSPDANATAQRHR